MNRSLYIGASSLLANQRRLDVLASNLANINTTGFKRDISITESFPEKLLAKTNRVPEIRNMPGPNNIEYENIPYGNGEEIHRASTKEGFFVVHTPYGKSYVKEIQFKLDDEGYLKTSYKDLNDNHRTDFENYIGYNNGNRLQSQGGNIEGLLAGAVHYPPPHVIGTISAGVNFQKIFTDFSNSGLIDTGGKFDLGLKGDGFFKIAVNDEVNYTRNGSFALTDGYLTDLDGNRVQGQNGDILINGNNIDILQDGKIVVDDINIDTLDIVNINNREHLRKKGDNLFYMAEGETADEVEFLGEVHQGHLETSNMNPISGMVEMINLLRDFEASQKIVRVQDEMLERAANEIGRI